MSDAALGSNSSRPPPEGAKEARARLVATPIILVVLGGILWIHDHTGEAAGTYILIALFGAAAGAEMSLLFRRAGRPAAPLEAAIWCGLLPFVFVLGPKTYEQALVWRSLVLVLAITFVLARHVLDTRPRAIDSIAARLVPILFVGLLFSFLADFAWSPRLLIWYVLISKASDMAGWAIGVPFGRHKLVPTVSPGKSWEGTLAGVAASVLVAVFLPELLGTPVLEIWQRIMFGFVLGTASVLAGVLWSGWKRRLGTKDSSALIPAMGGVMDMVDSLLLAAPAAHLCNQILGLIR